MTTRSVPESVRALALALVAGLWVAAPALGRIDILGARNNDLDGALWYRWYLLDSIRAGRLPDTTPTVAFPVGTDMLVRDGCNLLDALLSLPLVVALGPFAAHDAWAVLLVAANWLAFTVAARSWLPRGSFWATQLGAMLFALSPIALEELGNGRVTQAFLVWMALLLGELGRIERDPRAWIRGGVWLALTGLTYWYAAIWAGAMAAVVGLVRSPKRTVGLLGLSLLLVAPMLGAYALRAGQADALIASQKHMFVLWWNGRTALPGPGDAVGLDPIGMGRVLGFEAIAGALALGWLIRKEGRSWIPLACTALFWLLFAFGPEPFGWFSSPLYAAAMRLGPLAERLWFPIRALTVVALIFALALAAAAARLGGWRVAAAGAVAWLALLYVQGSLPLKTWNPPRSPVIGWLAAQPDGAVIALPSTPNSSWRAAQVQYQKPIQLSVGGDNPAPAWQRWAEARPALTALNRAMDGVNPQPPAEDDWEDLRRDGFAYVLVDRARLEELHGRAGAQSSVQRVRRMLGKPAEADAQYLAWRLRPADPR